MVFQLKKFVVYKTSFINEIVLEMRIDVDVDGCKRQLGQKNVYIP